VLGQSRLRRISVVGRRGHVQAAFTIKELRELTKLAGATCSVREAELALGRTPASLTEAGERSRKRLVELIDKTAAAEAAAAAAAARVVDLRFLLSPTEVLADAAGRVSGLVCVRNQLSGEAHSQQARPVQPYEQHTLPCGLLIRSIGYRSEPLPGVPFDSKTATVKHHLGRVAGVAGLYASGWLKRGPSGIIGTNINCARETVDSIVEDLQSPAYSPKPDMGDPFELAQGEPVLDWPALQRLDAHELKLGAQQGRARVKVLDAAQQMRIALGREP
jgi:NADPH-dependent glutamate synthase beta subunit-like oxidoreductase